MKYDRASTEPLGVIEGNECHAHAGSLSTARFQACFNEIGRLRAERNALVEKIKVFSEQNLSEEMDADQREHADFEGGYDRIVMEARECMARIHQQSASEKSS